MITLHASAHAAGRRIDLTFRLGRPIPLLPDVPRLRLVRRRLGFAVAPGDGAIALDLAEVFSSPAQAWARVERFQNWDRVTRDLRAIAHEFAGDVARSG